VVEIDNGRYDPLDDVRANARRRGVQHAILWDEQGRTTTRFKVPGYPYAMLVGPDGVVQWAGHPSKDVASIERWLERRLATLPKEEARPAGKPKEPAGSGAVSGAPRKEPEWLTAAEAFRRAAEDGKWVLLVKYTPNSRTAQKVYLSLLRDEKVLAWVSERCHAVVSDCPAAPNRREAAIWEESDRWDPVPLLWLVSADRKRRVPVDAEEAGGPVDAAKLLERLNAAPAPRAGS
jgi:hypothetical protein